MEEVGRYRLGSRAKRREVWTREQGEGEAVSEGRFSDDRGGGGVVCEGAEAVRLVSAMGLSAEGALADGGASGSSGAGDVEKGGSWKPCRRRG